MKWSFLMSREAQAPSNLDENIAIKGDITISGGSAFHGFSTRISKEDVRRLIPVWGLNNIK